MVASTIHWLLMTFVTNPSKANKFPMLIKQHMMPMIIMMVHRNSFVQFFQVHKYFMIAIHKVISMIENSKYKKITKTRLMYKLIFSIRLTIVYTLYALYGIETQIYTHFNSMIRTFHCHNDLPESKAPYYWRHIIPIYKADDESWNFKGFLCTWWHFNLSTWNNANKILFSQYPLFIYQGLTVFV